MGYYVTVQSYNLSANGLKRLPKDLYDIWDLDGENINITELHFKWGCGWFLEDLKKLAKAGVTGEVELYGEEGEWYKYVLRDGRVEEYLGSVVYEEEPNEIYE